jgi:indolepyruvate ferredoxin oxidoreductase beta subunit
MMENNLKNIFIAGVGGQGVLLASELLSEVAIVSGNDVKKSEVHGMSQRGGVVSSHVRIGKKVFSPIIPYGQADIVLSFELAEGLGAIDWLSKNGTIITSTTRLVPPSANFGKLSYPEDPVGEIKKRTDKVIAIDAEKMALDLGNIRLVNTILLAVASPFIGFERDAWEEAIRKLVKPKYVDLNLRAFAQGCELSTQQAVAE